MSKPRYRIEFVALDFCVRYHPVVNGQICWTTGKRYPPYWFALTRCDTDSWKCEMLTHLGWQKYGKLYSRIKAGL
jgi:hypothetical protein